MQRFNVTQLASQLSKIKKRVNKEDLSYFMEQLKAYSRRQGLLEEITIRKHVIIIGTGFDLLKERTIRFACFNRADRLISRVLRQFDARNASKREILAFNKWRDLTSSFKSNRNATLEAKLKKI